MVNRSSDTVSCGFGEKITPIFVDDDVSSCLFSCQSADILNVLVFDEGQYIRYSSLV